MAWTQADFDALNEAIISGAQTVAYEGKTVTYRSLDDMLRLQNIIAVALGLVPGNKNTLLVEHDRGYTRSPSTYSVS
jgi:hypothetical protein